ncbi:hypothetical protein EDD21DRAFT_441304 [Dissophora ornata]|nr:hypothetical protein EDD21DRAFT_441304 [Dissophora ornata]
MSSSELHVSSTTTTISPRTSLNATSPTASQSVRGPTETFPLTMMTTSPTTDYSNPLDPPQHSSQSDTTLTVVTIISCIGLLGFGIGYLRLRQMRRVNPPSSSAQRAPYSSTLDHSEGSHHLEEANGSIAPSQHHIPLPLYTCPASMSSLQPPEEAYRPHRHGVEFLPSYEQLFLRRASKPAGFGLLVQDTGSFPRSS